MGIEIKDKNGRIITTGGNDTMLDDFFYFKREGDLGMQWALIPMGGNI